MKSERGKVLIKKICSTISLHSNYIKHDKKKERISIKNMFQQTHKKNWKIYGRKFFSLLQENLIEFILTLKPATQWREMPYTSTLSLFLLFLWQLSFRKIKHSQLAGAWNFMSYDDDRRKRVLYKALGTFNL